MVNLKEENQICHYSSEHTMKLQWSKYLQIDNNVESLITDLETKTNIDLQYKYCHPRFVTGKRQKQLIFKSKYLAKQRNLKSKGELQKSLTLLDLFLDENVDFLW